MTPTLNQLRKASDAYRRSAEDADRLRQHRDALIRAALDAGMTHATISQATGLTRGRVGQIAQSGNL